MQWQRNHIVQLYCFWIVFMVQFRNICLKKNYYYINKLDDYINYIKCKFSCSFILMVQLRIMSV